MLRCVSVLACALMARPATAQEAVPDALRASVVAAIARSWNVAADSLQLEWGRLPDQPLPGDAAFRVVGRGADGWFAIVVDRPDASPYAVRARAGTHVAVPVATRALTAGHLVMATDVERVNRVHWGAPDDDVVPSPIGAIVRRAVAAGEVLRVPTIAQPKLVVSGDRVRVTFRRGAVSVSAAGTAISRGALGETISIRLDSGRRRVRGVVTGIGSARILK